MPAPVRRPGVGNTRGLQYCRGYTTTDDFSRDPAGSPIPFTASTPGLKRDGLNLRANGWRTQNYVSAGGPVLWSHNHQQPAIGIGDPSVETSRLRVAVRFDQEDADAVKIESKVRRGFLRSSSVGWDFTDESGQLMEHWRMTPDNLARSAFYDLTELSIVNVPADPGAVAERMRRGLAHYGRQLVDAFEEVEDPESDVTEPQLRTAVIAECRRLGIALADDNRPQRTAPGTARTGQLVRVGELPQILRGLGFQIGEQAPTTNDPAPAGKTIASAPAGIDHNAARDLLAAFTLRGDS